MASGPGGREKVPEGSAGPVAPHTALHRLLVLIAEAIVKDLQRKPARRRRRRRGDRA